MDFIKEKVMQFILSMLQPGLLDKFVDAVLSGIIGLIESVEARIVETPNKVDDMALPMLVHLRGVFEGFLNPDDVTTPTIERKPEPAVDPYTDPDG